MLLEGYIPSSTIRCFLSQQNFSFYVHCTSWFTWQHSLKRNPLIFSFLIDMLLIKSLDCPDMFLHDSNKLSYAQLARSVLQEMNTKVPIKRVCILYYNTSDKCMHQWNAKNCRNCRLDSWSSLNAALWITNKISASCRLRHQRINLSHSNIKFWTA